MPPSADSDTTSIVEADPPRSLSTRASAGAILRIELNATHGDLVAAIGHYHSHTPALAQAYRQRVAKSAMRLYLPPGPAPR